MRGNDFNENEIGATETKIRQAILEERFEDWLTNVLVLSGTHRAN